MTSEPTTLSVLTIAVPSLLAAATMGFAIQRGGTCMVAAVDDAVSRRRFGKLLALAECALWVSGLLALAGLSGLTTSAATSHAAGLAALAGGSVLGLGALVNGACVFGSIGRIGSGDLHFLLTPVGFFLGSLAHQLLALPAATGALSPTRASGLITVIFAPFLIYRLGELAKAATLGRLARQLWMAHHATIVIGVTFVVLSLLAGPWTYTDVLWRSAHTGGTPPALDLLLLAALLIGAIAGGWRVRAPFRANARGAGACLAGGALMGLGSALIPGGNDNLILVGLPHGHGYAWIAIVAMAATIALGLIARSELPRVVRGRTGNSLPLS